jgi:hypothetical protein
VYSWRYFQTPTVATMTQQLTVPVSKLDFDLHNPRYPVQNSDREALEKILLSSTPKSVKLAEHIVKHGQNPADPIYVIQDGSRYTVLEGNRRTAVLKILSKPLLLDSIPPGPGVPAFCRKMKTLAAKAANVSKVTVLQFASRKDADVWITLKHTGRKVAVQQQGRYRFGAARFWQGQRLVYGR